MIRTKMPGLEYFGPDIFIQDRMPGGIPLFPFRSACQQFIAPQQWMTWPLT